MGQLADTPPIIAAAMKKAAVVWLAPVGGRAVAAWLLWHEGSAYVVGGTGEQPLTGVEGGAPVLVTVASADKHKRLVTWVAAVAEIRPGSAEWELMVPRLATRRLSAVADAPARWARSGRVFRLTPTGELTEAGDTLPATSLAAPPVSSPATT
ncbi:MAG: hypothetical protein H0V10_09110 [Geodermatophilaceae bacterium]|nr:hypothetical protein [Geodermatophilaceae bacterium]